MTDPADLADQGGEAPCWAHLIDDLDQRSELPTVLGSNTIVYCERWSDVVAFYRDVLGLTVTMEREWFVEFELHSGAHISVADASRASIAAVNGSGLTLSWRVDDVDAVRARLIERGLDVPKPEFRWGAPALFVFDPAGNRIEFWAETPTGAP